MRERWNVDQIQHWIKNPIDALLLEQDEFSKVIIYYDQENSAFTFQRQYQIDGTKRMFNHILLAENLIEDLREELPSIFVDAETQLDSGKCWRLSSLKYGEYRFVEEKNCPHPHTE